MTHAIVLIEAEREAMPDLGGQLADVDGVAEAWSVTGEWDYVAMLRVPSPDQIAEVVTNRLARVPGIRRTHTMVAFEAGEPAAERRQRVALGLHQHDRVGHSVCVPPGSSTATSEMPACCTSALNASASVSSTGNVS